MHDLSPVAALCWFACARLGAVAVDTNTHYTRDELAHAFTLTEPVGSTGTRPEHARERVLAQVQWSRVAPQ